MRQPTVEMFLKDVAEHQMKVLLDNGVYRHLGFNGVKDSWNMWFELVTWPNHLTIAGDMGTWTFARLEDMFTFFRSSQEMRINPSYWSEKLQNGVHGGSRDAKVFDAETFGARLLEHVEGYGFEGETLEAMKRAVTEDVLCYDTEFEMVQAAQEFECEYEEPGDYEDVTHKRICRFEMCDLPDARVYCYHFMWCLYAIVWGIQQYDKANANSGAA